MPRKKKQFSFQEAMARLRETGINPTPNPTTHPDPEDPDQLPSLDQRIQQALNIISNKHRKAGDMIFFIMYDIEDNRVRRLVVKYLEQKGCHRVQKSIFLADLPSSTYHQIRNDLTDVQATYDNNDSILVVPISTDLLNSMRIIGKTINIDLILKNKNTLFF